MHLKQRGARWWLLVGGAPSQVGRCMVARPARNGESLHVSKSSRATMAAATAAAAAMHVRNYVVTSLVATSSRYLFMGMSCEGNGRNRHVRKASTTLAASCCLRPTFVAARTNTATARTLLLIIALPEIPINQ